MESQFRRYLIQAFVISGITYIALYYLTSLNLYLIWLIAAGLSTFVMYGFDKLEATRFGSEAKHRVPKRLLHLLALVGGFGGGWLGMFLFWHKIRQLDFWVVLVVTTMLHVMGVARFF